MRNLVGVATAVAILFTLAQVKVGRTERPDARAIGAIRAVVTAQGAYAAINGGYAPSLEALAMPCSVGAAGFISQILLHNRPSSARTRFG